MPKSTNKAMLLNHYGYNHYGLWLYALSLLTIRIFQIAINKPYPYAMTRRLTTYHETLARLSWGYGVL
jgi:hypothetical protein